MEEGGRVWEVRVREKAPVITLMFKVAEAAGVNLTANSAIFEICESLKIREWKHTVVRCTLASRRGHVGGDRDQCTLGSRSGHHGGETNVH